MSGIFEYVGWVLAEFTQVRVSPCCVLSRFALLYSYGTF